MSLSGSSPSVSEIFLGFNEDEVEKLQTIRLKISVFLQKEFIIAHKQRDQETTTRDDLRLQHHDSVHHSLC